MKGNCWLWAFWIHICFGGEFIVLSWAGGFPHFGVEIAPGLIMHFRRRKDRPHRKVPLWFDGELTCKRVKEDVPRQQISLLGWSQKWEMMNWIGSRG